VTASFHPSGYVRERAVDLLVDRDDSLANKALALRTTDWVDVVRQKARQAILERKGHEEALAIVPILVVKVQRERSAGLLSEYASHLQPDAIANLEASITAKAARRAFVSRLDLGDDDLLRRALDDEDPALRIHAARLLLRRRPDLAGRLIERGVGGVRALGVTSAPAELILEREDGLLLERRATIRRAAQIRLAGIGRNPVGFYRDQAAEPAPKPVAVVGLGETGGREDEPLIVELLQHDDKAIRRAALAAARWILSEEALVDAATTGLHDSSELVVRAAARLLRRRVSRIPKSIVDAAVGSSSRATHLAGLRLARHSDGWSRLEADLMLAVDADPGIAQEGTADLGAWVSRVAPTLYGTPPQTQIDSIGRVLDEARLERSLDREIRFHCGIDR
jgi:HEAT repeat protein